jgi:hypothetical protein
MNRIPAWIAIVLCSPYLLGGATLKVPEDYATIQEALDAAEQRDSVVVAPGTYSEALTFPGLAITLTSENPKDPAVVARTILTLPKPTGGGRAGGGIRLKFSVVLFDQGQDQECHLTGFTIQGGYGAKVDLFQGQTAVYAGGGVLCLASSPTVSHNVFQNNRGAEEPTPQEETWAGGVCCIESNAEILNNIFVENHSIIGGAMMVMGGNPLIASNLFLDNTAWAIGGIYLIGGQLINNTFVGNRSDWAIGHLLAVPVEGVPSALLIENNIFSAAPAGGGLLLAGVSGPAFSHNLVHGNQPMDFIHPALLDGGTLTPDPQTWLGENGNIGGDPVFVDARTGEFSLQADSPCINAGNPGFDIYSLKTDLAGKARVFAKRVDIGAYEFADLIDPLADAGPDQEIAMGDLVTLDGSASIFPDANSPPLFLWDQLEGPSVTLSDPLSMNPTFFPTQEGVYRFELRTYDGQRASRPDEVTITVVPAAPGRGRS